VIGKALKNGSIMVLAMLLLLCWATVATAQSWWNDDWQYRRKISINTTASGADIKESLMDVPILIRLHMGNFDFSEAQAEGSDIRFVSSDGTRLLKHHVERYDMIDEMALIWVNLPRLSAQSDQESIWLYYGNEDAADVQDSKSTYDASTVAVFHLGEIEGSPQDASAHTQSVTFFAGGMGLPAVIGGGLTLNGAGDRMQIASSPSLNFSNGLTFSAWVRINQTQQQGYLFHAVGEAGELAVGMDGGRLYGRLATASDTAVETVAEKDLTMGQWHHVMVTAAPNQRLTLFMDGEALAHVDTPFSLPGFDKGYTVGASLDGSHGFAGDLDEVQLATVMRPAAWAKAGYASQGPDGMLYSFGEAETGGGGMPVFYLGTILKNITIDGWLVIGLMVILMAASWVIFLSKVFFLWTADKANKTFADAFKGMSDPVAAFDPENINGYENSSLFKVYAAGCREVIGDGGEASAGNRDGTVKAFKVALEEGFINESKRLNAYLVVLTMAITGGPFLGLLGTVWGVMNTFAAMAEAGEANIMAIAPGVASALSTTVFGLIVAIPALFAYNFLTARIKNITADLTVFIDHLSLKVEQQQEHPA